MKILEGSRNLRPGQEWAYAEFGSEYPASTEWRILRGQNLPWDEFGGIVRKIDGNGIGREDLAKHNQPGDTG